jgi:hypothetical protein
MNEGGKGCSMKVRISIALFLALAPSLVFARPKTATSHMRPQLFRERTPKARLHETHPHEAHVRTLKSPPPPVAKEDFE